jgi:hypothetical protein
MGDELLLYVIHGTLHLAGYEDATPDQRQAMRQRESHKLRPRVDCRQRGRRDGLVEKEDFLTTYTVSQQRGTANHVRKNWAHCT